MENKLPFPCRIVTVEWLCQTKIPQKDPRNTLLPRIIKVYNGLLQEESPFMEGKGFPLRWFWEKAYPVLFVTAHMSQFWVNQTSARALWLHSEQNPGGYCWWKKSCTTWDVKNLVHNGIYYLSTGPGFLPSTVWSFPTRWKLATWYSTNSAIQGLRFVKCQR